jgi:hypothetical protein
LAQRGNPTEKLCSTIGRFAQVLICGSDDPKTEFGRLALHHNQKAGPLGWGLWGASSETGHDGRFVCLNAKPKSKLQVYDSMKETKNETIIDP